MTSRGSYAFDVEIFFDGHELRVKGEAWPFIPAKTSGAPDSWAPAEGGEVEDLVVFCLRGKRERRVPAPIVERLKGIEDKIHEELSYLASDEEDF